MAEAIGKILLVGMMGAGKTTVGGALAERLGCDFVDTDSVLEQRAGRSVAELWEAGGEAAFRVEERDVVAEVLASDSSAVVSVAGGAVLDTGSRERIAAAGPVVWLRADVSTLAQRVGEAQSRPLLKADPRSALTTIYGERRRIYEELATLTVDVDGRNTAEVVATIARQLTSGTVDGWSVRA